MNPLELVAKTLYSFKEQQLTFELLDAFGKQAQVFQQYDDVAKIFFELRNSAYIVSLQYHLFEPLTDRLSISIPMIKK